VNRKFSRTLAVGSASTFLLFGLAACGGSSDDEGNAEGLSGTLNGGGASSQESAVAAWRQGFQNDNADVTVNYDPVGSGGGREQFIAGGLSFAGSDAFLDEEELTAATERCASDIVSVPVYVSPIAVIYQVEGVKDLKLDAATLGAIFEGKITKWNDDAIKALNPDAKLPDLKVTPVHRADDSGTTKNFTDYLTAASGGTWSGGVVETWPIKGGEAADGTSGVVSAVKGGTGTIGYADASQAGDLATVQIKVGDEFVSPTAEAAAQVLDTAEREEGRVDSDIALKIDRTTTASGVYPVVMVSYQIACQEYEDKDEQALVKSWLTWVASEEGQKAAAESAGSAPLSKDFAATVKEAIDTIG
jgi:phosphate transport system substrate-binding protein